MLPREGDRAVIHDLVFAEQQDLRHWPDHLRFDPHDLEFVGADPGASLEFDWIDLAADVVAVRHVWAVVALSEMYQPGCSSVPISEPFTAQLEIVTDVGVKDQSQAGKASAGDAARIIVKPRHRSPVFIYGEEAGLGFGDGCDVIVFAAFCVDRIAHFVDRLMGEVLDRSDTGDAVHKFFDALSGFVDDLACRTLNTLRERWSDVVDARRLPGGHCKPWRRDGVQCVYACELALCDGISLCELRGGGHVLEPRDKIANLPGNWIVR